MDLLLKLRKKFVNYRFLYSFVLLLFVFFLYINIFNKNKSDIYFSSTISINENQSSVIILKIDEPKNIKYSISGVDSEFFNINNKSGFITLKKAADYEDKNFYSFVLSANINKTNNILQQKVFVNIIDIDEAPIFLNDSIISMQEKKTFVINLITKDESKVFYSLSGKDSEYFLINKNTGELRLKEESNYNKKNSYTLFINASDNKNISKQELKVNIIKRYQKTLGTVIDNASGLMWQDNKVIKKTWVTKGNYELSNYSDTSGDTASTYCKNLELFSYTDWRLPSVKELLSIVDKNKTSDLKIDSTFENNMSSGYWTSTIDSANSGFSWFVSFKNGYAYHSGDHYSVYVRCVRNIKK